MKEISKNYDFGKVEDKIYAKWEKSGYFNPDNLRLPKKAQNYSIIMPPPNVTGILHMGSAMMLAVEDLLIRYNRMQGKRTVWIPGADHAAIATQNRVEKNLRKKGLSRHKLGREKFLKEVEAFANESQKTIISQMRKMGSSCDWSRFAYTMDETRTKAVRTVFKMMYEDGLIYRGERVVNWCPRCHSTLADDEVEYKNQKAVLYFFKYSKDFPITIATTRPETKLGDTAVAVNPKDARYKKYVGKEYVVDFVGVPLKIKVIADRTVDMNFGTGAVGVTPAHSMADSQLAASHNLRVVKVINEEARIREGFGRYSGKNVSEARKMIIEKLKEKKLIQKEEEIDNNLSVCYRCETSIEPLPSLQWFIDVNKKIPQYKKSIKELCLGAAKTGVFGEEKIKFVPKRFEKIYLNWMENLRDWCISRQIWFGHRVPVWYKKTKTKLILIRHAQTDWNVQGIMQGQMDIPLNKNGEKQAEELREIVRKEKVDVIIISPLKRTRQTAKIINTFNLPIIEDVRLKERSYGKFEGMKTDELLKKHPEITTFKIGESLYWIDVPTAETYSEVRARVREFIEEIKNKYPGKNVMIVSHGDTLDMFYAELNGVSDEKAYGKFSHNAKIHEHSVSSKEIYVGEKAPIEKGWTQDEDTLDTWFSSGMWPFSVMAKKPGDISLKNNKLFIDNQDFKNFCPTSVLETMYDILFFWVARMIIMTTYAIGEIPFRDVYLHGCVRDKFGDKMSKSKPKTNINPIDVCEKYGTDAVRLSLIIGTAAGSDLRIYEEKIEGFRNMVTKLWNIFRFCQNMPKSTLVEKLSAKDIKTLADKWIVSRMEGLISEVTTDLEKYQFSLAGEKLKDFMWNELADWYVEISKKEKNVRVLGYVLSNLLRLWHPFMPYITEEIFSLTQTGKLMMVEKWPRSNSKFINKKAEKEFAKFQEKIVASRFKKVDEEVERTRTKKEIANLKKGIAQKEALLNNKNFLKSAPKNVIEDNENKLREYKERLKALTKS